MVHDQVPTLYFHDDWIHQRLLIWLWKSWVTQDAAVAFECP